MRRIQIGIVHPSDPVGPIPGGIDTVIRGVLKHAPPDLDYTLFGATSDLAARPVGHEISVRIGDRSARFIPVVAADPSARRGLLPLSVRFMWGLRRYLRSGRLRQIDIFDFHRIEPIAIFKDDPRPKNVMLHQDMADIRDSNCDIGWRHAPWLYERMERLLFTTISHVFCVRQSAVDRYQSTYPALADRFSFLPTWVDTELFYPPKDSALRENIIARHGIPKGARLVISIGRLDRQKDPLLMLDAMGIAMIRRPDIHLLLIGDGNLRPQIEERSRALGLDEKVTLFGARQPEEVADLLRASDLFVLSSAYEGMPIVVLEALATGVPVVTTRVGEVERVVQHGINGAVVTDRTPQSLASALCDALTNLDSLRGIPCEQAVIPYYPGRILSQIYENHRGQGLRKS
jgi:glycosyltransferase involved in cell wall biosynthesis